MGARPDSTGPRLRLGRPSPPRFRLGVFMASASCPSGVARDVAITASRAEYRKRVGGVEGARCAGSKAIRGIVRPFWLQVRQLNFRQLALAKIAPFERQLCRSYASGYSHLSPVIDAQRLKADESQRETSMQLVLKAR
jgi:hypothetical protein